MTVAGISRIAGVQYSKPLSLVPSRRLRVKPLPRPFVHYATEEDKTKSKRKFITREEEPDQYWMSEGERQGRNPLADPLAIIGLIAIFAPFVILGIAAALGYVDLTP